MILDITTPAQFDEPLPPPAWLVGGIVATVIFAAAALIAAIPHDPVLHANGLAANTADHANAAFASDRVAGVSLPEITTPIPFDPINLSLPLL